VTLLLVITHNARDCNNFLAEERVVVRWESLAMFAMGVILYIIILAFGGEAWCPDH